MPRCFLFAALACAAMPPFAQAQPDLLSSAQAQLPTLTETYHHLHSHPELSRHEEQTAAFFAAQLKALGYTVTDHVGRFSDGTPAFGVVGLLANGPGPRVLLRTELDALPVVEKTGLSFASTVKTTNAEGQSIGVMHACGHDLHMTALLGAARELAQRKSQWHGTVMIIGQPAEETVQGATAMLADNLYERFGRPDFIVSEHDWNGIPADSVAIKDGPLLAGVTSINVRIRGIGAHGSAPQSGKDPIVLAAEFILVAQTIVSRQVDPRQPAVLTVGTIHGGTKNNIIPDEVTLGMTLRTYSPAVQDQIVAAVRRTANGLAEAYGIPADRMPVVTTDEGSPATINDAALAGRLRAPLEAALGKEHVLDATAVMASEDVGSFTLDGKIPGVMIWLGAGDPAQVAESRKTGVALPSPHSPLFAPDAALAIPTGVTATTAMAMNLLQ
jgi:hippurate hydrolase